MYDSEFEQFCDEVDNLDLLDESFQEDEFDLDDGQFDDDPNPYAGTYDEDDCADDGRYDDYDDSGLFDMPEDW